MVPTHSLTPETLRLELLRETLSSPGPCISILLPPYRPGEPAGSQKALLKSYLHELTGGLAQRGVGPQMAEKLIEPLERAAADPELEAGSQWSRAFFRSPTVFEHFVLTQPVRAQLAVGGSFAIRSLAPELVSPSFFYILALSKEGVHLLRCAGVECEEIALPPGVPATLEGAMAFDAPDHDLENRSPAGGMPGMMHRVRFGTGSGRELKHTHLADFYKLIDRAFDHLPGDGVAPLVLAGPEEAVSFYRGVSAHPHLAHGAIFRSPDLARDKEGLLEAAYEILRTENIRHESEALKAARERYAIARVCTDPETVLHAAIEGRVGQLFLAAGVEKPDVLERGNYRTWGPEDMLNVAAVQTVLHHGKTSELPPEYLSGDSVVAFLRF